MAWPISNIAAPNVDSGFTDVPTSATSIEAGACWLIGATFTNTTTATITVTLQNTANVIFVKTIDIPPGVPFSIEWPFLPTTGVKWSASVTGVTGKVWGYK